MHLTYAYSDLSVVHVVVLSAVSHCTFSIVSFTLLFHLTGQFTPYFIIASSFTQYFIIASSFTLYFSVISSFTLTHCNICTVINLNASSSPLSFFFFRAFRRKKWGLLLPLVPLTFVSVYNWDMAYGPKLERMRGNY